MYAEISNENYGYSVATYGKYVAVGNPSLALYDPATSSFYRSGSIDIYKYDPAIDEHAYVTTLFAPFDYFTILLGAETGSNVAYRDPIFTESSSLTSYSNRPLEMYSGIYTQMLEDSFGVSLDIYDGFLVVGNPYWRNFTRTVAFTGSASGSGVDIFDLSAFSKDRFNTPQFSDFTSSYVGTIQNPSPQVTSSFGLAVAINNDWIAVGSPYVSSSNGAIYLYNNPSGDKQTWQYVQTIIPPASASLVSSPLYGKSLRLNKQTGSKGGRLIVGTGNPSSSVAILYEYSGSSWTQKHVFYPSHDSRPLTFGNYSGSQVTNNTSDGFGTAVAIYGDTVGIGSPFDRIVYEFSGSSQYRQGAAYIFQRCDESDTSSYSQVLKTNGNEDTLKRHFLGYSVDVFGDNIVFGLPKTNILTMTSCFIGGTINQLHFCEGDLENSLQGQFLFYQRVSGSWTNLNTFQKKKRYLSPYRAFGRAVSIADMSLVVGSPMMFTDANRIVNYDVTPIDGYDFGDVSGKSYIYNLKNLHSTFNVGNVFYRNGKVILMTSGSDFNGLLFNPITTGTYEYQLDFKSQRTIFEKQVICSVEPGEFNVSTNPSALVKVIPRFDINNNGVFDFQDADIILRYMQYLNTRELNIDTSTDWSSSIVVEDDEQSYLRWCQDNLTFSIPTDTLMSESFNRFEFTDTWMASMLDLNQDSRVDVRDMSIMWKYFSNRLTQQNYSTYIIPSCQRKLFSDIIDYLNPLTLRNSRPQIKSDFLDYTRLSMNDKTGSYLAPYVTTIGLYNDLELVAVAKLGTPIKLTSELPINFVVKMDF